MSKEDEKKLASPSVHTEDFVQHGKRKKSRAAKKIDLNVSNEPSYTNFTLPYTVRCRRRYIAEQKRQRNQFIKEIKQHELLQSKALDGTRIHREFCDPIISPAKASSIITLTQQQKRQLEEILKFGYYNKIKIGKCPTPLDNTYQQI